MTVTHEWVDPKTVDLNKDRGYVAEVKGKGDKALPVGWYNGAWHLMTWINRTFTWGEEVELTRVFIRI